MTSNNIETGRLQGSSHLGVLLGSDSAFLKAIIDRYGRQRAPEFREVPEAGPAYLNRLEACWRKINGQWVKVCN